MPLHLKEKLNGLFQLLKFDKQTLKRNKTIFANFSYLTILEVVVLVFPLLTYPYLIRILGKELYGWVITASIIASYGTILIEFGFKRVSARHISINRNDKEKLSEIVSSIFALRGFLWLIAFVFYAIIIYLVPYYRQHYLLFIFSYGMTFNALLFPEYYFQGIENMKYITITTSIIKLIFVLLTFIVIKSASDYIYVPVLHSAGFIIGGAFACYIIFCRHGLKFKRPSLQLLKFHLKDATPIFASDVLMTVKDKLNYIFLGSIVGMNQVVIYDIGSKLMMLISKPSTIILNVLFPRMAREGTRHMLKKIMLISTLCTLILVIFVNLFMPWIVELFLPGVTQYFPIRLFTLCPLIVGISGCISVHLFIAKGYNRYVLASMIFTTISYVIMLGGMYFLGILNSVTAFVWLAFISFLAELINRIYLSRKLLRQKQV